MKNICLDRNRYNNFLDRDIDINDNNVIIRYNVLFSHRLPLCRPGHETSLEQIL